MAETSNTNNNNDKDRYSDEVVRRVAERVWKLWREDLRRELERRNTRPVGRV